jgi:hypothetical protein
MSYASQDSEALVGNGCSVGYVSVVLKNLQNCKYPDLQIKASSLQFLSFRFFVQCSNPNNAHRLKARNVKVKRYNTFVTSRRADGARKNYINPPVFSAQALHVTLRLNSVSQQDLPSHRSCFADRGVGRIYDGVEQGLVGERVGRRVRSHTLCACPDQPLLFLHGVVRLCYSAPRSYGSLAGLRFEHGVWQVLQSSQTGRHMGRKRVGECSSGAKTRGTGLFLP